MQNLYSNKILPLTVKQLKKAELDYRTRKQQVYNMASYEFVTIVARVVKVTTMEIKLSDQTEILEVQFHPQALRKAADPVAGRYYKFSFFPRRNVASSNSGEFLAFQIVGMIRVNPNQITIHLLTCMQEKMGRQNSSLNSKLKDEITRSQIPAIENSVSSGMMPKSNLSGSVGNSKKGNGEYEISKYCRELGKEFDVELIVNHFKEKFSTKDVEKVLQTLSEKGSIMDLGLVYEWIGDEE